MHGREPNVHNIDMSGITRVEDFTPKLNREIIANIRETIDSTIPIKQYYVVGSYCFNIPDPDDLDIICVIPRGYQEINPQTGQGYHLVNMFGQLSNDIRKHINTKVSLHVSNVLHGGYKTTQSGIEIPSYNLRTGNLEGKDPLEIIPYHFHFDHQHQHWVTIDRTVKTELD